MSRRIVGPPPSARDLTGERLNRRARQEAHSAVHDRGRGTGQPISPPERPSKLVPEESSELRVYSINHLTVKRQVSLSALPPLPSSAMTFQKYALPEASPEIVLVSAPGAAGPTGLPL